MRGEIARVVEQRFRLRSATLIDGATEIEDAELFVVRHAFGFARVLSRAFKSAGRGDSQLISSSVKGCTSFNSAACKAWRGNACSAASSSGDAPRGMRKRPP